jgi:hypothetical protein
MKIATVISLFLMDKFFLEGKKSGCHNYQPVERSIHCTENCNGTVIKEEPYCKDCVCKPVEASPSPKEKTSQHKCPHMRAKK